MSPLDNKDNTGTIHQIAEDFFIDTFALGRYSYGEALRAGTDPDDPTIIVVKLKGNKELSFSDVDLEPDSPLEMFDTEKRNEGIVSRLQKMLSFGVADYAIAVTECGMYVGTKEESDRFHKTLQEHGPEHPEIKEKIERCCSFVMYDLSGVVARSFATSDHCVATFEAHDTPETLLSSSKLNMSQDVQQLSRDVWVYCKGDDLTQDDDMGPLRNWSSILWKTMEDLHGPAIDQ